MTMLCYCNTVSGKPHQQMQELKHLFTGELNIGVTYSFSSIMAETMIDYKIKVEINSIDGEVRNRVLLRLVVNK